MKTNIQQKSPIAIEGLESRIAPAAVFTFTDVDGDKVTIRSSKGNNFDLGNAAHIVSGQLQLLDLSIGTFGSEFKGADISITATPSMTGDGHVNVGFINATGADLGAVSVGGDLGRIYAGDATTGTAGLKSLAVSSLGRFGPDTQVANSDIGSVIVGAVTKLSVKGDMASFFSVTGGADGKIGSIKIGGSVVGTASNTGQISVTGDIGMINVAHDLQGGSGGVSGFIESTGGKIHSVIIGGSIIGGSSNNTGQLSAAGDIESVKIGHNVQGGGGFISGSLSSGGKFGSVAIGGSLIGGAGGNSGELGAQGDIGSIKIGHDVTGGGGEHSGEIRSANGKIGTIIVGGSLLGSLVNAGNGNSGLISSKDNIGTIFIGKDVKGGAGVDSGSIVSTSGAIGKVTIGGSIIGGANTDSGILLSYKGMGIVKVGHDVRGGNGLQAGTIYCSNGSIQSVTIGGSLIGGNDQYTGNVFASGDLGFVKVGENVQGGSGTVSGLIFSNTGNIAGVQIGGSLIGGANGYTGSIVADKSLGPILIGHDVLGGSVTGTNSVDATGLIMAKNGRLAGVEIGGSIIAGIDDSTGFLGSSASIVAALDLGPISIAGNVVGSHTAKGDSLVVISGGGSAKPGLTTDLAIAKITVGGRVERAEILAGFDVHGFVQNGDAQMGAISVGGDWIASNAAAGAFAGKNGEFGDIDDAVANPGNPLIFSKIASIVIGGQVVGTPSGISATDHFGFVAQRIGSFKAGGFSAKLTSGPDAPIALSIPTGDVTIREI